MKEQKFIASDLINYLDRIFAAEYKKLSSKLDYKSSMHLLNRYVEPLDDELSEIESCYYL